MKIDRKPPTPPPFNPITITLETEEEAQKLLRLAYVYAYSSEFPQMGVFRDTLYAWLRDLGIEIYKVR